jgi:ABC-type antimicrobial peptide transport system permease subunit
MGPTAGYVGPIRAALQAVDRHLPVYPHPVNDLVWRRASRDVLLMRVATFFGAVALVLAALGLYGLTSHATSQRTNELGLRSALGASQRAITAMVVGEALRLGLVGVVVGVPVGLFATRLIRAQLFGVQPVDGPSLAVAAMVLVSTAVAASYLPARRAARVDPSDALRAE